MVSETGKTPNFSDMLGVWKYFLSAAVFAVFTSAVVLSDSFREYEADTTVLVIAAADGDVIGNIQVLSETGAFLSVFLSELRNGNEHFSDIGKEDIRDILRVEKDEKGSVLHVRASASDPDIAKDLSRKASLALFRTVGRYYDVHDVDFRIIDGPSADSRISSLLWYSVSSVASGVSVTTVFFIILIFLPSVLPAFGHRGSAPLDGSRVLDSSVFEPERPDSPFLAAEHLDREEAASGIEERSSVVSAASPVSVHKAHAPMNLPALSEAEERFLKEFSFEGDVAVEDSGAQIPETAPKPIDPIEEKPEELGIPEPTEEEYRRRLSELLRG